MKHVALQHGDSGNPTDPVQIKKSL
jgi:hypothetical protein